MARNQPKIELLGDRLRFLICEAKRLNIIRSMKDLQDTVGYSYLSISYWCSNSRRIPKESLKSIARTLKVSPEYLIQNTIQVTGKKCYVNYSKISFYEIVEAQEYLNLSIEEVQNVLLYKKQNPDKIFTIKH